jgi:hypothetical protein
LIECVDYIPEEFERVGARVAEHIQIPPVVFEEGVDFLPLGSCLDLAVLN